MANKDRKGSLRSLDRDGASFIFRHKRLLVGWHVWENNRTEAWLRELTPSEASSEHTINDETDWYRTYTSSDGSEQMLNDVMNINEVHPALLEPHDRGSSELFLTRGRKERLEYLMDRYKRVASGRCKYREQEAGELKSKKLDVPPQPAKSAVRKRKRENSCSEASECDTTDWKRHRTRFDGDGDDDEELPVFKSESTDMSAMDQITASSATLQREPLEHIADLNIYNTTGSNDGKGVDRQPTTKILGTPELRSTTASAKALKGVLLNHISQWAESSSTVKLDLTSYTGELYLANTDAEIVIVSQNILHHVTGHHKLVGDMRAAQQQILKDARANGMPVDMIRKQEELVDEYKETEKELQAVVRELTRRVERLQAGLI